jgi:hypothetical protein
MRLIGLVVVLTLSVILVPLAAQGQRAGKVAHIGYLSPLPAARDSSNLEAFRQGLRDLGYVEGRTALIDARYADGKLEMLPNLAAARPIPADATDPDHSSPGHGPGGACSAHRPARPGVEGNRRLNGDDERPGRR